MTTAAEMGALQLQAKEGQRTQRAELMAQMGKNLPANQEAWVRSLGREDSLKQEMEGRKEMETEEPGGLQFMGLQRVGHD